MSTVQEVEQAVQKFSAGELAKFRAWFAEFDAREGEPAIRGHGAFLRGYEAEDEGLYDDERR